MDTPSSQSAAPLPLLSVWLRPRATIEHIVASKPGQLGLLLLACLAGIALIVQQLVFMGGGVEPLGWRPVLVIVCAGIFQGIAGLYIGALLWRVANLMFGGHASVGHMRAVLSWSSLPMIAGLAISVVVLLWVRFSATDAATADRVISSLELVTSALGLWSFVTFILMNGRVQKFGLGRSIVSGLIGWLLVFCALSGAFLLIALGGRTFLFQPFNIPSGAQKPTLLVGDYIFVSKYAYGYSRYSFPFAIATFKGRLFGAEPQRGDLVVFRLPKDDRTDYVKRVVGLPGDRIQMINGLLHINGQPVDRERVDDFADDEKGGGTPVKRWRETLPNGAAYETLDLVDNGFADNTREFIVPRGEYFVLGDNRDNSTDSRFSQVGTVPLDNFVGRVEFIYFSRNAATGATRLGRLGRVR